MASPAAGVEKSGVLVGHIGDGPPPVENATNLRAYPLHMAANLAIDTARYAGDTNEVLNIVTLTSLQHLSTAETGIGA